MKRDETQEANNVKAMDRSLMRRLDNNANIHLLIAGCSLVVAAVLIDEMKIDIFELSSMFVVVLFSSFCFHRTVEFIRHMSSVNIKCQSLLLNETFYGRWMCHAARYARYSRLFLF